MSNTSPATDCHEARQSSVGERLRRLVGLQPVATVPVESADLEAMLAYRGLTSFVGLPQSTFFP